MQGPGQTWRPTTGAWLLALAVTLLLAVIAILGLSGHQRPTTVSDANLASFYTQTTDTTTTTTTVAPTTTTTVAPTTTTTPPDSNVQLDGDQAQLLYATAGFIALCCGILTINTLWGRRG